MNEYSIADLQIILSGLLLLAKACDELNVNNPKLFELIKNIQIIIERKKSNK